MLCPNPDCPDRLATGTPGEYRLGVGECPYCGSRLVESLPTSTDDVGERHRTGPEAGSLEAVLDISDPSEIPVLESILRGAGIPFVLEGMERFRAFTGGSAPFRYNPRAGTVTLVVPAERAEEARALLTEVDPDEPDPT